MSEEMIEKVARAIDLAIRDASPLLRGGLAKDLTHDEHRILARAAIAAYNPNERLTAAVFGARLARANWQKYNSEQSDEVVYQAEKMASSIDEIVSALSPLPQGEDYSVPQLTVEEEAEMVERINANPLLHPKPLTPLGE